MFVWDATLVFGSYPGTTIKFSDMFKLFYFPVNISFNILVYVNMTALKYHKSTFLKKRVDKIMFRLYDLLR